MKLRRVWRGSAPLVQVGCEHGWTDVREILNRKPESSSQTEIDRWSTNLVALLGAPPEVRADVARAAILVKEGAGPSAQSRPLIPFEPRSYRDFMIYERHAIDAARGFVRRFMPHVFPIARSYERLTKRDFPKFKPAPIWYRQPIFYMGNHMSFVMDGAKIACPSYSQTLDYELELGFVLAKCLFNATPEEAEAAIGGFVVLNDFTARDVQYEEMQSGFGPAKAKHFANAISSVAVTADEVLPKWRDLKGYVRINDRLIAEPAAKNARWSLGQMLAYASRSERLYPGEFFGTGTLPGGSGIETGQFLSPGDVIQFGIGGIGAVTNTIVDEAELRT